MLRGGGGGKRKEGTNSKINNEDINKNKNTKKQSPLCAKQHHSLAESAQRQGQKMQEEWGCVGESTSLKTKMQYKLKEKSTERQEEKKRRTHTRRGEEGDLYIFHRYM